MASTDTPPEIQPSEIADEGDGGPRLPKRELWGAALEAARKGDARRARHLCAAVAAEPEPFPGAHHGLLGRCLAEADKDPGEAIELLRRAREANPRNIALPHVLALALLRGGEEEEAASIFKTRRLPHDIALLGQVMLTIEERIRPWPEALPPEWPAMNGTFASAPGAKAHGLGRPRKLSRALDAMERDYFERRYLESTRRADETLAAGLEDNELHLIAGLACEEAGDEARARAHLARAQELEPKNLLARTALARVYWRSGWLDLAEDLLRSVPIEGPDDFGRHYHLALVHDAAGRRGEALLAMGIALKDFFIETREFHIDRAYRRWLAEVEAREKG